MGVRLLPQYQLVGLSTLWAGLSDRSQHPQGGLERQRNGGLCVLLDPLFTRVLPRPSAGDAVMSDYRLVQCYRCENLVTVYFQQFICQCKEKQNEQTSQDTRPLRRNPDALYDRG